MASHVLSGRVAKQTPTVNNTALTKMAETFVAQQTNAPLATPWQDVTIQEVPTVGILWATELPSQDQLGIISNGTSISSLISPNDNWHDLPEVSFEVSPKESARTFDQAWLLESSSENLSDHSSRTATNEQASPEAQFDPSPLASLDQCMVVPSPRDTANLDTSWLNPPEYFPNPPNELPDVFSVDPAWAAKVLTDKSVVPPSSSTVGSPAAKAKEPSSQKLPTILHRLAKRIRKNPLVGSYSRPQTIPLQSGSQIDKAFRYRPSRPSRLRTSISTDELEPEDTVFGYRASHPSHLRTPFSIDEVEPPEETVEDLFALFTNQYK